MSHPTRLQPRAKFFSSRLFFVVGLVVLALISTAFVREVLRRFQINREIDRLEQQANQLKARNDELVGLSDYFSSSYFQEREARLKLGLERPGETAVVVPSVAGASSDSTVTPAASPAVAVASSNPEKWWQYFFGSNDAAP